MVAGVAAGNGRAEVRRQLGRWHRGQEHLPGRGRMQPRPLAAAREGADFAGPVDLVDEHDTVAIPDREVDALAGRGDELGHDSPCLVADIDRVEDPSPELNSGNPSR